MKLIIVAIFLAVPVVLLVMKIWIQGFAYQIPITGIELIEGGIVVLLISLLTVSVQTFKAARANPVKKP